MVKLSMSRRTFVKAAAVTAAATTLTSAIAPLQGLAEGEDTTAGQVERIRSCCRACGKCECGVWVTVQDGKVIRIEGDESAPQSRGHCCAKSQASMQALYHPDRLRYALKRTKDKGSDDPGWVRITLDEAFELCGEKFGEVKDKYGGTSIFVMCGTSRVWSLGPYQGMKQLFGTPNADLAYQVCKGPRHFAGIMTDEMGSPWMEVEQEPSVYVQWGTACEYSNYDSTNRTVNDVAAHAKTHILVDPRITPLGKEADIWLPLRPGTDGALALSWMKWCYDNDAFDDTMVRRWSNASFLVVDDKEPTEGWLAEGNGGITAKTRLLTEADMVEGGKFERFMVWDENNERLTYWDVEVGEWENERHRIPTTGQWIEHPYKPLVADAWLPDQSSFADPATESDRFYNGSSTSNPKGLAKKPSLKPGDVSVTLKDGSVHVARSVWDEFGDLLEDYTPEKAEKITGVPADKIVSAVKAWTTHLNPDYGNGGIHFQLATDQNGNSIQNCRVLQLLSCLTGNSDMPAGNRGSSKSQFDGNPGRSNMWGADLNGVPYGDAAKTWTGRDKTLDEVAAMIQEQVQYFIDNKSPLAERYNNEVPGYDEAIVITKRMGGAFKPSQTWPNPKTIYDRNAGEIDAARFPLNRYWGRWADSNTVWDGCNDTDVPYQLHAGLCQSGDFMNMGNILVAWEGLQKLDFFTDINLWHHPNNGQADVIFPCAHWLEIDSTRVSQGAGGFFGCCCKAVEPQGDVIYDPNWNVRMYKAMGVPWNTRDTTADAWPDESRILKDNVDAWKTAEFPDGPTWEQAKAKFQEEGWFDCRVWHPERWGTYRRHEMGYRRQQGGFNLYPLVDAHPGFMTPSGLIELWSLDMEAYLDNNDDVDNDGLDHFPVYREPTDSPILHPEYYTEDNSFLMTTGSRQPVYFHSEHRQLPWCRELWPAPRLEMNPVDASRLGLEQGDWVWIESPWGKVREVIDLYYGISAGVVNANHGWWFPEMEHASKGFELVNINCVMDPYGQDFVCGAATMRSLPVKVYKATADNSPFDDPVPCDQNGVECIHDASDERLKDWLPVYTEEEWNL